MSWFLVALGAPLLYTAANYIDKFVLSHFVKEEGGIGGIVIFSSLFAGIMIPISFFIDQGALLLSPLFKISLVINGVISMSSLALYLNALHKYETSLVVPLYQLIPVFSYILGYLVLGEKLTIIQMALCALIIVGAFLLSLATEGGEFKLNGKLLGLMSLASFFSALSGVIFKKIALDAGYWQSQFWEYAGIMLLGVLLLIFLRSYRRDFFALYRAAGTKMIKFGSATEGSMIGADLLFNYAVLLAPVALVYVVNSLQPLFVLIVGALLTKLLPGHFKESLDRKNLVKKFIAILLLVLGGIGLAFYG